METKRYEKVVCEFCGKILGRKEDGQYKIKTGTVQCGKSKKNPNLLASFCNDSCADKYLKPA